MSEIVGNETLETTQRAALITGASGGIGFALADLLARRGHAVTVVSRQRERIEAAADRLAKAGAEVEAIAADLTDPSEAAAIVDRHRDRFGRLDALVNNAGFGVGGSIAEITDSRLDLQYAINLRAPVVITRQSLGMLASAGAEHGNALVLNVSSISGKLGTEWLAAYSAMKHGVVGFTQAVNRECFADGIKACALCPGYVDTDLTEYLRDTIPREEMIRTSDITAMVDGLLSLSRWCVVPEILFTRPGDPTVG